MVIALVVERRCFANILQKILESTLARLIIPHGWENLIIVFLNSGMRTGGGKRRAREGKGGTRAQEMKETVRACLMEGERDINKSEGKGRKS